MKERAPNYSPEIDSLRAIAVLAVLGYHLDIEVIGAGFLGVDVFFVISGYLITDIIRRNVVGQSGGLYTFYIRRLRRLFPALAVLLLSVFLFSTLILMPHELKELSEAVLSTVLFSSNFYFWVDSGYFATDAKLLPLLHTWSLSVEEQFYFVFPLFLITLHWLSLSKRLSISIIFIVCLGSFGLAEWAANGPRSAAFFFPITRAWELIVGGMLTYIPRSNVEAFVKDHTKINLIVFLSLLAVLLPIVFGSKLMVHPGINTIPVVIGTALLIALASYSPMFAAYFRFRGLVFIGLFSYSLYLWHWPLISLYRHLFGVSLSVFDQVLLLFLSIFLGWASWKYIEQTFRGDRFDDKTLIRFCGMLSVVLISLATVAIYTNGFFDLTYKYRFTDQQRLRFDAMSTAVGKKLPDHMYEGECVFYHPQVAVEVLDDCKQKYGSAALVVGDSHAMNVSNILANSGQVPFLIASVRPGCRAATYETFECEGAGSIDDLAKKYLDFANTVVYHQSGGHLMRGSRGRTEPRLDDDNVMIDDQLIEQSFLYADRLSREFPSANVVYLGPFVEYRLRPSKQVKRPRPIPVKSVELFKKLESRLVHQSRSFPKISYVAFDEFAQIPVSPFVGDCFIWRDGDHLSECGERVIAGQLPDGFF